jgi:6-pyruvoyltetrahydropterin/6-carboxytetrahydropterin synthase
MYSISKEFTFSASHQLKGLPDDHPCSRLHGHNYIVDVVISASRLDEVGFVYDYRKLDQFKHYLDRNVDHRHLNDVFTLNPTAELLAVTFWNEIKYGEIGFLLEQIYDQNYKLLIGVSETPKTWAHYDGEHDDAQTA